MKHREYTKQNEIVKCFMEDVLECCRRKKKTLEMTHCVANKNLYRQLTNPNVSKRSHFDGIANAEKRNKNYDEPSWLAPSVINFVSFENSVDGCE